MSELLKKVEEKDEEIQNLASRLDVILDRLSAPDADKIHSLPGFDAFGWEKLGIYIKRLEDAVNEPLLEEARIILEGCGIKAQNLEYLRASMNRRRREIIAILKEIADEISRITDTKVRAYATEDIQRNIENGDYEGLLERAKNWTTFSKATTTITKDLNDQTHLYRIVLEKALQEGPSTRFIAKLNELEDKASRIGGKSLSSAIRYETTQDRINPILEVDEKLDKLAKKKEEYREIVGGEIDLNPLIQDDTTLDTLTNRINDECGAARSRRTEKYNALKKVQERRNFIAAILEIDPRPLPSQMLDLVQLEQANNELLKEAVSLEAKLEESLTPDARALLGSLLERKLPDDWKDERIVNTMKELLRKGASFQIRMK